ncbi:MAG: SGNH/GDSL hydrolase family protein [Schlesneria sp.]
MRKNKLPPTVAGFGLISFIATFLTSVALLESAEPLPTVVATQIDDPLRMALPPEVFALAGVESNIYFDNIVLALNPANYVFDITCPKGKQQAERWTWTPTEADVGDVLLQFEVRDDLNRIVSRGRTTIKVSATKSDKNKSLSLLLVGDSLTHASIYSQHLLDLAGRPGQRALTLIGSHGVEPTLGLNRHEGYGGWTAHRFATHFTVTARLGDYAKRGSPFLYKQADGTVKLDFQHYCQDLNEGRFPDAVTIFLGPNDIFSYQDETIEAGIQEMLGHYDKLIEMVKTASPITRIGVMLPVPPAASQDAFGNNYASGQTRWQYKRNQHFLVSAMIKRYGSRQSESIHLIPTHVNLDTVHNYPTETVLPNAHAELKVVRQSNGVHPAATGYRQIGDTVYAWLASLDNVEVP